MNVQTFTPDSVMTPIGPYRHMTRAGAVISLSATAGVDPASGMLAGPYVYSQTRQILRSFRSMLEGAGSRIDRELHLHVFLLNMEDFEETNRAYSETFCSHAPARSVVGVGALHKKVALLTMNLTAVEDDKADELFVGTKGASEEPGATGNRRPGAA